MSSNSFYNYSGSFIPGTLARAEALTTEFSAVQAGFALLVVQGVDSGVANAYVVTTTGQPTGAYADGNTVEFKPLAANTGASTLSVNSIPAVSILRFNGAALVAGDLSVGVWTTATYNSLYSAFTLVGPGQTAVIAGSISSAAPTHKVGLTAAGGSSTQAAPIDATYAIDQSIAPTWTGNHTFTPVAGSYGVAVQGSASSGNSFGVLIQAGTTAADSAFSVLNAAASSALFKIFGDGHGTLGPSASLGLSWAAAGNVTIAAPSSGAAVTATAAAAGSAFVGTGGSSSSPVFQANGAAATALSMIAMQQTAQTSWQIYQPASSSDLRLNAGGTDRFIIANTGAVTIPAPSSGTGLTVSSGIEVTGGVASTLNIDKTGGSATHRLRLFVGDGTGGTVADDAYISGLNTTIHFWTGGSGTTDALDIGSAGNVTIAAPSSGTALTVNALTGTNSFLLTGAISGSAVQGNYTNTSNTANSAAVQVLSIAGTTALSAHVLFDISGVQDWYAGVKGSNSNWSVGTGSTVGGADKLSINTSGAVTIAAPSGGQALTVTGVANQYTVAAQGSATSGQSYGLLIQAGTTSGDQALAVLNTSAAAALFRVFGDGGVVVGNPTGGDQGAGTINAAGYYINGVAVPTASSGSFTATGTGFTANPTGTAHYAVSGNVVTLTIPALTGTSNAITFTITGLPAGIQPARAQVLPCPWSASENNSVTGATQVDFSLAASSGTITVLVAGSSAGFSASNTKGLVSQVVLTYLLN
jgi:hypothetical protein